MATISSSIGIVIVSYNASDALAATLASVRRATNDCAVKVILVDNASNADERSKIRTAITSHIEEIGDSWRYIEQPENLGFSGGNNIGIQEFLADEDITHICLLNGDVIVTNHWLDRLLAHKKDIISAVTNKADSEQCIPVSYDAELSEFVNIESGRINEGPYRRVQEFADQRHTIWQGNLVETDVTFFCVLLTTQACREIGLLDETFFPGGFEDDDYCLRARELGYDIFLARDTFIHHWGSASFGKLQYEYFSKRAKQNKDYLEKKHGIVWRRRPEKPIVSFCMDVEFALRKPLATSSRNALLDYVNNLDRQINYFETEFRNLTSSLNAQQSDAPEALIKQVAAAQAYGDISAVWTQTKTMLSATIKEKIPDNRNIDVIVSNLSRIAEIIYKRVECNFSIHSYLTTPKDNGKIADATLQRPSSVAPLNRPTGKISRLVWLARKGAGFLWRFNGIVFFGGYFYPERQSDGYFQRIQIVDRLFEDRWRVYVETEELAGRNIWFDRPQPNVLVLRVTGSKPLKALVRLLAVMAVMRTRKIYFHSVLRMYDNRFGKLLTLPFLKKAVDIHGVVPEEFRMHDDFYSALIYDKEERSAVKKAGIVIVVTDAMKRYLQQKFRDALRAQSVSFPMFPSFTPSVAARPLENGKPIVVYAGGLHRWQQVPKMIDAITKTISECQHRFYCSTPETVVAMLPVEVRDKVVVESKTHADLMTVYPQCHYGFILREDSIVNKVACPTKLVEYLAMGIVPIVDCEHIGDFKSLGMHFITLADFLASRLPDEKTRTQMAANNLAVYEKLQSVRQTGAEQIYNYFTKQPPANQRSSALDNARRLLPPQTLAGRLARRIWKKVTPLIRGPVAIPAATPLPVDDLTDVPNHCDVLVQVDNFEAGGLENVVLDLNDTLTKANLDVTLLVLGNQGPAVEQARFRGQKVLCKSYDPEAYEKLVDRLQPKLVLAHYSTQGVQCCQARNIPFLQVIHNIYMWFDDQQRRKFAEDAQLTTKFIAVSDYARDYSITRLGVPAEKCVVIPNGIDFAPFDEFSPSEERTRLRRKYGLREEDFVFISIGAINHQKNQLGALKAFEIVSRSCDDAKLVIFGPAYEKTLLEEINSYITAKGLSGKAFYCGPAPRSHEYFTMADAFVSGAFFEGAQLILLEAIRSNLPVVTSRVGIASLFEGRPGIKVVAPSQDMSQFNGAIWELKSSPTFEQQLADAMIETCKNPIRPNLEQAELDGFERSKTYEKYTDLIGSYLKL
nr:glycosyltransferase [Brucella anthropi]